MWDFFETVRHRHSVRSYQANVPVETDKLNAILEMATAAPSAGDLQAYRIFVVTRAELRALLSQAAEGQDFIAQAPLCLTFCSDPQRSAERYGARGKQLYALQDATIAAAYAQLAAAAAGLGSTWVGRFDSGVVRKALNLETHFQPVALLCVGYSAEPPSLSSRRRLEDMVKTIP